MAGMQALRAQAEAATYPETLGALIDDAAARNGDQLLAKWITDGQTMTYAEYARLTRKLASSLEAQGIRKGTHVGVMLPNVPAFVVTWGALARIGAVMIPVNISYTETELKFVLTDADAQFIVMDHSVVPVWEAMAEKPALVNDARVIVHGGTRKGSQDWQALLEAGEPDYVATSTLSRTDLLNLQYTSGTTGFPKGCMLSHEYWILLGSLAAKFRGRGGDVKNVLINAPFFYMDPMWQFIMTMVLDGTAKIAPRISLSNLYNWLVDEDIHYCIFPQPGLKAWPEGPEDRNISLRYVSIFGWSVEAREEVERGQVLAHVGTITPHKKFKGEAYILSKDEGGRHTPFFTNYRPQFYFRTTDVTGVVTLDDGVEMVMPGDNVTINVELINPIAMDEGLRFAIREGGRTVGAGVVASIIE